MFFSRIPKQEKDGFTLVEILVASAIFAVAVGAMMSVFVMSLKGQRNIRAQQNLIDNTRFATEYMSRQIRMAQRDEPGTCTGTAGTTYSAGGSSLTFIDYRNPGKCVTYGLSGTQILAQLDTGEPFVDMTSDDILVTNLEFVVQGRDKIDLEQPRVTIVLEAEAAGEAAESKPNIQLQTTISARNIDVP